MKAVYTIIILAVVIIGFVLIRGAGGPSETATTTPEGGTSNATTTMSDFMLTSDAFAHGDTIPSVYTCDGENISPPLTISGVPDTAQSLALVVDDPDVPAEVKADQMFVHWVHANIPTDTEAIPEGGTLEGVEGVNGSGSLGYTGPCPPTQYEPTEHRYFFKLYALDTELDVEEGVSKDELEKAMEGHVIEQAELMGRYDRTN